MPNYYAHKDKQVWGLDKFGRIVSLWSKPSWDAKHVSYAQLEDMQKPPIRNTQYRDEPNDHLIYGIHFMEIFNDGRLMGFDGKKWQDCTNLLYTENEINTVEKLWNKTYMHRGEIVWRFGQLELVCNTYNYSYSVRFFGDKQDLYKFEQSYTRMQLMKQRLGI